MRLLLYKGLNLRRVQAAFDKVKAAIEADDFRFADVKKLHAGPYYRARLGYADRLLLQFARVARAAGPEPVCLALEVIENHAYERSRFLRGAAVDEARIEREPLAQPCAPGLAADAAALRWLGPGRTQFELLDKPIVFDDAQEQALRHPAPLVVIGSAGSGKTAVTLARLRETEGRVLYVTLSAFAGWCERHRQSLRPLGELDAQALFEEFRGVIGAQPDGPLALADYLALGARQSLLDAAQREVAHGLFERYRAWLDESNLY